MEAQSRGLDTSPRWMLNERRRDDAEKTDGGNQAAGQMNTDEQCPIRLEKSCSAASKEAQCWRAREGEGRREGGRRAKSRR